MIIKELNKIEKDYKNQINNFNNNDLNRANYLRNQLNSKLQDVEKVGDTSNTLNLEILKTLNSKDRMKNNKLSSNSNNDKKNMNSYNKNQYSNVSFIKNDQYKSKNISSEINVIGLNVDEAIFLIDKYLDDCAIAKLSPIRIVHGKGTGKLRQGIHSFLKTNSHVKSFRIGTFGEGEMGVTVVELK